MTRREIAALGSGLGPDVLAQCRALFDVEQRELAVAVPSAAGDLAYGPHERHRLDLYGANDGAARPVIVFVHGGGFVLGDKGGAEHWANAAVGRWAAQAGYIGAVINYRLAPEHQWPAGSEDVAAAVDWLRANVSDHGGDPERIVLCGTSAGAVHIVGCIERGTVEGVRGAVLLSGLYGFTPPDPKDLRYFGEAADYPAWLPTTAIVETGLPLFVAAAEFDPPRFQAEFLGLMQARLGRHGTMPRGHIAAGHNHYTMAMHLGTGDRRLGDAIDQFIRDVT